LLLLQEQLWNDTKMVCRAGGNYGEHFGAYRGVTQEGPFSSLMFNVCVDCVIREWLHQVMGDDVAREGVGVAVRNQCNVFFVDDGFVSTRCPEWLQSSFDILIKLFERIVLLEGHDLRAGKDTKCPDGSGVHKLTGREHNNYEALLG
jgi:hypothetical protein